MNNSLKYETDLFKNLHVIFCLPGKQFSNKFLIAWTKLYAKCLEYSIKVTIVNKYTSNVYFVRNMCLGGNVLNGCDQKPFNGEIKYDYLFWIDSDIIFEPEQFFYMLYISESRNNIKVLSGLYVMEDNLHFATVKKLNIKHLKEHGHFEFIKKDDDDFLNNMELQQVKYTGFGFMLIKYGVFEELEYPWFSPTNININTTDSNGNSKIIKDFCSEDVSFCLKLNKLGIDITICPKVIVKHEKIVCLF